MTAVVDVEEVTLGVLQGAQHRVVRFQEGLFCALVIGEESGMATHNKLLIAPSVEPTKHQAGAPGNTLCVPASQKAERLWHRKSRRWHVLLLLGASVLVLPRSAGDHAER